MEGLSNKTKHYQLQLNGFEDEQGYISITAIHQVLGSLIKTAKCSTLLLVNGIGTGKGPIPSWLKNSLDFKLTEISDNLTVIDIEAPFFRNTAEEEFAHSDFRNTFPDLDSTALDVALRAIQEARRSIFSGELADKAVLDSIANLRHVFINPDMSLSILNLDDHRQDIRLDLEALNLIKRLSAELPKSGAYLVSGTVEHIDCKSGKFLLRIGENQLVPGRLSDYLLDAERLESLQASPTLMEGFVHFKVDGTPRYISTVCITENTSGRVAFDRLPEVKVQFFKHYRKASKFDLMSLWGKWPGDETYEELMEDLDLIRKGRRKHL